jgi:hypothetical protein
VRYPSLTPSFLPCPAPPPHRFVGEVTRVDPTLLRSLVNSGYIPVVATVATDESGQALNVNADTAAGEVSAAEHSVFITFFGDPKQRRHCSRGGERCQTPGLVAFIILSQCISRYGSQTTPTLQQERRALPETSPLFVSNCGCRAVTAQSMLTSVCAVFVWPCCIKHGAHCHVC